MLSGTIAKKSPKGFMFIKVEYDPTGLYLGQSLFCHYTAVDPNSEVSYEDSKLGDVCELEAQDDQKGPRATLVFITARQQGEKLRGVVTSFDPRGYSFVRDTKDGTDYFLHASELPDLSAADVGLTLEFESSPSPQGRPRAIGVRRVDDDASTPQL